MGLCVGLLPEFHGNVQTINGLLALQLCHCITLWSCVVTFLAGMSASLLGAILNIIRRSVGIELWLKE